MVKKRSQQFEGQLDDEEVLLVFRRHPIVMRKGLIFILLCILCGAIAGSIMSSDTIQVSDFFIQFFQPLGISLLVGAILFFYFWIGWYYTLTVVTNQRLLQIHQEGLWKKRSVSDIDLTRILSINYEQHGLLENMLGFGTIIVQTLVGDLVVHKVGKPASKQRAMLLAIKESGVKLDENTEAAIN